jgi:predicted Zn finger-like uncharacterized protein
MYTRCPHCNTHFRVTRQQLQASSGQVRCGRCQQVFDAFATLSSQLPSASPPAVTEEAPTSHPETASEAELEEPLSRLDIPGLDLPEGQVDIDVTAAEHEEHVEPEVLTLPDDLFNAAARGGQARRRWAWFVGSALLGVLLIGQVLFFFSSDLAGAAPDLRPALTEACRWLGCSVALSRFPDQLFIEASDLQVLNSARPNEVLLTATIRNRAAVTQQMPLLELTLTDALNQAAARKVFYPADYLDKSQDSESGIAPSQEIPVKLYLDTGDVRPTGYRLYLFFG